MEQIETKIRKNAVISHFMGWVRPALDKTIDTNNCVGDYDYSKSWDKLFDVVKRINSHHNKIDGVVLPARDMSYTLEYLLGSGHGFTDYKRVPCSMTKENVWDRCYEYILYFNKQNGFSDSEQVLKSNEIIAKFMGFQIVGTDSFEVNNYRLPDCFRDLLHCSHFDGLYFDISWDWIMLVFDKIESMGIDTRINHLTGISNGEKTKMFAIDFETEVGTLLYSIKGEDKLKVANEIVLKFINEYDYTNGKVI